MSDNRFKIVFDGALLTGVEQSTAQLNLADLFNTDAASIESFFSGHTVALKRDLSHNDAETCLQALTKAGIDARIEAEQPAAISLTKTQDADTGEANDYDLPASSPYAPPQAPVGEHVPEFATLKVFSFSGRIGRLRMLARMLVVTVAFFTAFGLVASLIMDAITTESSSAIITAALVVIPIFVLFSWISAQITVQRLHDLGWSGWLWFLNLVPFVGSVFPILLLVLPGNTGANRYGAPPPPNSKSVKVLSALWVVLIALVFITALLVGMTGMSNRY